MKKYEFHLKEHSIFSDFFRKQLIHRILLKIPHWIHPNTITFASFFVANLTIFIIYYLGSAPIGYFLITLSIITFIALDGLDGDLARFQHKESALGEFSDHMIDIYSLGVMLYTFFFCFYFSNTYLMTAIFLYLIIYQAGIYSEQKHTKVIVYDKVGPLEGILILIGLIFLASFINPSGFLAEPFFLSLSPIECVAGASIFAHAWFTIKKLIRHPIHHKHFYIYMATSVALIFVLPNWKMFQIALFLLPFNIRFSGKLISSHLLDEPYPHPDLIAPLAVLILPVFSSDPVIYMGLPICYLWARIIIFYLYTATLLHRIASKDLKTP